MRPRLREALARARRRWRAARKWARPRAKHLREAADRWEAQLAQPLLLLAGWAAITTGVAELFGAGRVVYPIGAGLLAWGLYGYKTLGLTLWIGLVALRKMEREHPEDR